MRITADGEATEFADIPGTGPHVITPATALPSITDPVTIDGSAQSGNGNVCTRAIASRPSYKIVLDGTSAGTNTDGLTLADGADGSTIKGLNIRNFDKHGIEILGSADNTVACNFIGTGEDGATALGNACVVNSAWEVPDQVLALSDEVEELSRWLLSERSPMSTPDPRWDRLIYPIHEVENYLKAKAGSWW